MADFYLFLGLFCSLFPHHCCLFLYLVVFYVFVYALCLHQNPVVVEIVLKNVRTFYAIVLGTAPFPFVHVAAGDRPLGWFFGGWFFEGYSFFIRLGGIRVRVEVVVALVDQIWIIHSLLDLK